MGDVQRRKCKILLALDLNNDSSSLIEVYSIFLDVLTTMLNQATVRSRLDQGSFRLAFSTL